jgi:hypothetical protein
MDYKKMKISEMGKIMQIELPHIWEKDQDMFENPLKQFIVALSKIENIDDNYYLDSATEVIGSALGHDKLWKTEKNQCIKYELKRRLEAHNKNLKELNSNGGNSLF